MTGEGEARRRAGAQYEGDEVVLTLACTAEGMDSQERWTLTRNGADGMKVSRAIGTETIDVDLIRCR